MNDMKDMNPDKEEKNLAPTRSLPAVNGEETERAETAPDKAATEPSVPETHRRPRRADRYRENDTSSATAAFTEKPVFRGESATAREIASRMQSRPGTQEPGSRIPPQAARMSAAARAQMASRQTHREQVGYAPGRMQESEARAARERTESPRTVSSGVSQRPARPAYPSRPIPEPPAPKRRRGWIILLCVLLVLVLLAAGLYLIPENTSGFPGELRRMVFGWIPGFGSGNPETGSGVNSFIASGYENTIAPTDVGFTVTTARYISDIRLTDEYGEVLLTSREYVNNTDQTIWNLSWHLEEGYEGEVRLQVLKNEEWIITDNFVQVKVESLPTVETEIPVSTPAADTLPPVVSVTEAPAGASVQEKEPAAENEPAAAEMDSDGEAETETNPEGEGEALSEDGSAPVETWEPDVGEKLTEEEAPAEEPAAEDQETLTESDEAAEEALPEEGLPEDGEEADAAEEAPEQEFVPAGTPEPTATPQPEPMETPKLTAKACEEADPSLVTNQVIYNGTKRASEYTRNAKEQIAMPMPGEYTRKPMGVFTFRNDAFRQNAACGTVSGATSLELVWTAEAGSIKGASQTYYGIGWTGQPAIVKWSKEVRELSDIYDGKKEKSGLREVIVAGLDGMIYFLDLADGTATRNSIRLGYPMKGSPSVHPGGAPYMNVGQFARKMAKGTGKIGLRQYNLYTGKEMNLIDGLDSSNRRAFNNVGSFETSALIDRTSDTLITAGTNGLLYVIQMGSTFDYKMGTYTQSPGTVLLKSKAKGESDADTAVEASVAMYDKYVFYADVGGILRCVDTNTMKTVWAVNTEDTVESTIALDFNDEDGLNLYTANLLSKRKKGDAKVRCFDAMSGEEKWAASFSVKKDTKTKTVSGFRASPVVGQNELAGLVYYTVNGLSEEGAEALGIGESTALIAIDGRSGRTVWARGLDSVSYSSPVAVYSEDGRGWIIQCEGSGTLLLLDGQSGKVLSQLTVEGSIEGSPAVYNDMLVVGTTGRGANYIYGIRILNE